MFLLSIKKVFYLLALVYLVFIPSSFGATYYMRADGTAPNKASATGPCTSASASMNVTVHNGETFSAGDTITVCGQGGQYRSILLPPSSGSSGAGNTITYLGNGSPILSGADSLTGTGWTQVGTTNEWYKKTAEPEAVWIDATGQTEGTVGSLTSGKWGYGTGRVYIYSTTDPSGKVVEGSIRYGNIFVDTKSYLVFDGLELRYGGASDYTQRGLITIWTGGNHTIQNCHIHDSAWYHMIYNVSSSNNTYSDNTIHTVLDTHPSWHYGCAIFLDNSSSAQSDSNTIQNNTIYGVSSMADLIGNVGSVVSNVYYGGDNNIIQDNTLYGPAANAIYMRTGSSGNIIRRNYIHDIGGIGVQIRDHANNNKVYNNIFIDCLGPVMQSDGLNGTPSPACDGNKFWNNTIINWNGSHYGTNANAIHIFGINTNCEVKNNIVVSHNGDCLFISDRSLLGTASNYNRFYKTGTGSYLQLGSRYLSSLASWQTETQKGGNKQDNNSSEGNPGIVSLTPSSASDVNLVPSSPCKGTGVNDPGSGAFNTDYLGNLRPQGLAWDIGAYEYYTPSALAPPTRLRIIQ